MLYQLGWQQWGAKLSYWADDKLYNTQFTFCYPVEQGKKWKKNNVILLENS